MKYDKEIARINRALRQYAWAIIEDSKFKDKWQKGVLEIFVNDFIGDEIQLGWIKAELNLKENLETEYLMT